MTHGHGLHPDLQETERLTADLTSQRAAETGVIRQQALLSLFPYSAAASDDGRSREVAAAG